MLFVHAAALSLTELDAIRRLNARSHRHECEACLRAWPTIASAPSCRSIATTPRLVGSDALVAPGNAPFGSRALVHATVEPVLAPETCADIIAEAEERAAADGWGSRYTLQSGSDELHLADLPRGSAAVAAALPDIAAIATAALLPPEHKPSDLRVLNALVVRYDAARSKDHMAPHGDANLLTVNVALSAGHEGGGTWFLPP